jgi:hypothetical protein
MGNLVEFNRTQGEMVEVLSGQGVAEDLIVRMIGLRSVKSLRSRFGRELDLGPVKANYEVASSLYDLATKGKNGPAMMFWLKCRAKWDVNPQPDLDHDVDLVFGTYEKAEDR